jgi:excisionase family DNA binding protein
MERLLFRVPEVAEFLSISESKVYELIANGVLPSVRLDGCRRVRSADLLAYVDSLGSVA